MRFHAARNLENTSKAVAGRLVRQTGGGGSASRIVDNRPEAAQLARIQLMANNSRQAEKTAQLQDEIGSSPRMVAERQRMERMFGDTAQLAGKPEEELQMKAKPAASGITTQLAAKPEEELQMKAGPGLLQLQVMEEEELQMKADPDLLQLQGMEEEELQMKASPGLRQLQGVEYEVLQSKFGSVQKMENKTGLPDRVKTGVENLSGVSLDNVNVHFNSAKPAQLNALAYTQGTDIHVGPGQEKHLPHEAWHVVQQSEGRVKPTVQMSGTQVNDDRSLEREADVMGAKALQMMEEAENSKGNKSRAIANPVAQKNSNARQGIGFVSSRSAARVPTTSQTNGKVLQKRPTLTNKAESKKSYSVEYQGRISDFEGGENAKGSGIVGVTGYSAVANIEGGSKNQGQPYADAVGVDARVAVNHRGHILAKFLGGSGDPENVFRQEGGQNTAGDWPSFERRVANAQIRGERYGDGEMNYTVTLTGSKLEYGQEITPK